MEVLYPHCAGLDVHKETVVACMRHMVGGTVKREVRTFDTTTTGLLAWRTGWHPKAAPWWPWRRRASTGSRSGMS